VCIPISISHRTYDPSTSTLRSSCHTKRRNGRGNRGRSSAGWQLHHDVTFVVSLLPCRRFFFSPLCGAHICAAEFVSCKYGAKSCFEVTLYAYEGWLCTARLSDQSGVRAAIVFDLQHDMTDVELFMQYLLCLRADLVCTTHHHVIDVDMRFKVIVVFAHRPRVHVMDISHSGDPFDSSS